MLLLNITHKLHKIKERELEYTVNSLRRIAKKENDGIHKKMITDSAEKLDALRYEVSQRILKKHC
jgi:hypothetical protein